MKSYLLCVLLLIVGYLTYGKYLENNFGVDNRKTPVDLKGDGVDYVEMGLFKSFFVQFLNIAGLGPITGAVAGAMWGTSSFIWIVVGCIFAGAVHDYYTGMVSMRNEGKNMPELIGKYLGERVKFFTKYLLVILLIIVGVAFVTGPAEILKSFTGVPTIVWIGVISVYYVIATLLPIDKIIGKVYPLFGAALVVMMFALIISMFWNGIEIPEIQLSNMHVKKLPIFPYMFVVISCGAISGFHSTQSVMVARCLKSEKYGRKSFMAAMYLEGFVALTWAAIALGFFKGAEGLAVSGGGMVAVSKIVNGLLGKYGLVLTMAGLIALPISTGDTAFRSARMTIADAINLEQKSMRNRLKVAVPMFITAGFLSQIGFTTLWKYVASVNQMLACIGLWMCTYYMIKNNKNYWVVGVPAVFMTAIIGMYFVISKEWLGLNNNELGYFVGIGIGVVSFITIYLSGKKNKVVLA